MNPMVPMLRAMLVTILMLAGLNAEAKVNGRCILTLEARPGTGQVPAPQTPCPVAVGYTTSSRPPAAHPNVESAARTAPVASARDERSSDPSALPQDGADESAPTLDV